jgi:trans-2,3-dihydro-3-hydroxyanthranilate isomerase
MADYRFRIINVFAETPLGGNPLAVFEDGRGLDDANMQALALQFNLSETTFILPSTQATARVRIFTPTFEMPFAGHPTLGTAHVVRDLTGCSDAVSLEMLAGIIPVTAAGDVWTLRANAPRHRPADIARADLAAALGIAAGDIADDPLWVDTGSEQLIVPLCSVAAVERCRPDAGLLTRHCHNGVRAMAYVWAADGNDRAKVRFFFPKHGGLAEDPGTGSACANLGGYLLATGHTLPLRWTLNQGEQVGRQCVLHLGVGEDKSIHVGGRVIELGRGSINLK